MNKIIYYVASSLDGFISGVNDDISKFISHGEAVEKYKSDLLKFKTVIMGRKTYEFGYQYGLEPGKPAYSHMQHYIFSDNLQIEKIADQVHLEKLSIDRVQDILDKSETDVYLCGGGKFAGWLLDHNLIDQLKLKLNPIVLGDGVRLFGESKTSIVGKLIDKEAFDGGLQFLTYDLK